MNTADPAVTDQAVKELTESLGVGIRRRRKNAGLTLANLASTSGVSLAFLSQVENGAAPSLYTLHRIAAALGTTIQALLHEPEASTMTVTRSDQGKSHHLIEGATVRFLAGGAGHSMEANETIAVAGTAMDEPFVHAGEDLVVVLEGAVEYEVDGEETVVLHAGDVAMYSAEKPHLFRVVGDNPARFLYVNAPGSF